MRMAGGFLIKFLGTIMDLLIPWILAYMIDEIVPTGNISKVLLWGFVMFICAILAITGNIIANRFASKIASLATETIRHDLFSRITSLSEKQVGDFTESSLISRITSDSYNVHNSIGMMQRLGVRAPILLVGGILVTMTLDPILSLVLVVLLPFMGILVYAVSKKGIPMYSKQQESADRLIRKVRENISGVRVIKALSRSDYERDSFVHINHEVADKGEKAAITMGITNPAMNFILNVGWVLVIIVGAIRVNGGLTESGKIVAFLSYFTIILNAMLSITRLFVKMSQAIASADRIAMVIDCCEDMEAVQNIYFESDTKASFIEFRNVSFSYLGNKNNFSNISFSLNKGESLGIIGATGSGKSTIANLLMRFYDVTSGEILINGRNINTYEKKELYGLFGTVFQNDMIFEDTIKENISLGRELSENEIKQAAINADIDEFIRSKEEGYEFKAAIKGANLSGGQKQRIFIARALASKPPILILDDSSSALDYKTDHKIRKAIKDKYKDSTVIIIAQRVSSVMSCTNVLVLDGGKNIGYGTHDELMKKCPVYNEIGMSQLYS